MILPKLREADIWVFATPVYVDGIIAPMKNLIDRMLPFLHPFIKLRDGHSRHPLREGIKLGQLVLVSNCGFWEMDNFDPLLVHAKAMCRNFDMKFGGALLRPHGTVFGGMLKMGAPVSDVVEAAKESGRQLVRDGEMSTETLQVVSRELLSLDMYEQDANRRFRQVLEALGKK